VSPIPKQRPSKEHDAVSTPRWPLALLLLTTTAGPAAALEAKVPADALRVLEQAETFELYSLQEAIYKGSPKGTFQSRPVLGKTVVKDKATQAKLVAALTRAVEESGGKGNAYGFGRHGIRATHKGKTVEIVIWFDRRGMDVRLDGKSTTVAITATPEPFFDKVLQAAGVPLRKR
jgi:hypothetical protein